ncbi:unnamed protein product [Effrenium voratum]|nr:unnamed protein product [Effrenium voratum]
MASPVWCSSAAAGSGRREAVLELHRRFFVEKRGMDGINEQIEARTKERLAEDRKQSKEYWAKLRKLDAERAEKAPAAQESTGLWTEQQKVQAVEKLIKERRDLQRAFKEERGAMTERVRAIPALNVRTKEEMMRLRQAQDPEAAKQIQQRIKDMHASFKEELTAMTARLDSCPPSSRWSAEKQAKMEELKREHALQARQWAEQTSAASQEWQTKKKAMLDKLQNLPALSFRSPREKQELAEGRRDPEETKTMLLARMHERERTAREQKAAMLERVQQSPRKTFWSPAERDELEARRCYAYD